MQDLVAPTEPKMREREAASGVTPMALDQKIKVEIGLKGLNLKQRDL